MLQKKTLQTREDEGFGQNHRKEYGRQWVTNTEKGSGEIFMEQLLFKVLLKDESEFSELSRSL